MWSPPAMPKQRVRAELLNICTAGIDTHTLTTLTLLLVVRTQRYMWSLDKTGCIAKWSQQSFCHWWQNMHYYLTNLQNHITTNLFDVVRIITSKQQIFSVRSSPDPPIFKKLQSDPVLIRPKLASVLIPSDPVLIRAHLCYAGFPFLLWLSVGFPPHSGAYSQGLPEVYGVWNFWLRLRSYFGWIYSDSAPTHFKLLASDSCSNSKKCLNDRVWFSH